MRLYSIFVFVYAELLVVQCFYLLLPEEDDDERLLPELLEVPELLVTELPLLLELEPLLL